MADLIHLRFKVNGQPVSLEVDPGMRLLDVLREKLFLTGTKEGCGKGECGACTVLMNGLPVDSCLVLAIQAENAEIVTIEGLEANGKLHSVQQAFIEHGSSQCGFCIPGFVMSAVWMVESNPEISPEEMKYNFGGNLCRCTGYQKIFEATLAAAREIAGEGKGGR